jgi:hypothetical protein
MASDQEQPYAAIEAALKKTVAALRDGEVPFLIAGSFAAWARGGPESRRDVDVVVKPEDAERALEALEQAGMRSERPPEEWLYKAWDGDVLIDVIFHPQGLEVTDDVMARGDWVHVLGITIPVMGLEDLLATKLLSIDEHELDYSSVIRMARALREQIDWRALRLATRESAIARAFFVLVEELGIASDTGSEGADVRVLTPRSEG